MKTKVRCGYLKKLIGLIVTLSLIFACGCEKQEQNQGENGSSNEKKDVLSTLVCTKTTEEDGEKSTNIFEITSKWMELRIADLNFVIDTFEDAVPADNLGDDWFMNGDSQDDILSIIKMIKIKIK